MKWSGTVLSAVLVAWPAILQAGEPYRPESDEAVLERVRPASDPEAAALRRMRARLQERPGDQGLAVAYARQALELARATGDPRYTGYAEAALSPWWGLAEPPVAVRVMRATIAQRRHDFQRALVDLNAVLEQRPRHAQARLTRAAIHTVQARYPAAVGDCSALVSQVDALVVAACIAQPASLSGRAEQALDSLATALASRRQAPPEIRRWAWMTRAEIAARLGRVAEARAAFEHAIDMADGDDVYTELAHADFLLAQGEPSRVLERLDGRAAVDGALLRLALAEKRLARAGVEGMRERLADHREELRARFQAVERRGDPGHRRERAMFELHIRERSRLALWLARANWRTQKEPIDARLLLEAAIAAERPDAAQPVLDWLAANGVDDVGLQALARRVAGHMVDGE